MTKIFKFISSLSDKSKAILYLWMWIALPFLLAGPSLITGILIFGSQVLVFMWNVRSEGEGREAFSKEWKKLKKLFL